MDLFKGLAAILIVIFATACNTNKNNNDSWKPLLDKELSQWDVWLGIPHKSTGIAGYENQDNVKEGIALGLVNKRKVFSVIEDDNELLLKVSGEIFGSLASKQEFKNYHLKLEVKWGDKKWEPQLNALSNNGILYHSIGEHGSGLWETWMSSLEFEVEARNFGDYISINDENVKALCPAIKKEDGKYHYAPSAPLQSFIWTGEATGRCYKSQDFEKSFGEWNTLELICFEDMAIHIVNGEVVNAVYEPRFFNGSEWIAMNKGKIQLQSEGAETYFKNIEIKSIKDLPNKYQALKK